MSSLLEENKDVFDPVDDCQAIFRTLMMATAYPGLVKQLRLLPLVTTAPHCDYALQPLITLLDIETSHHVYTHNPGIKQDVENFLDTTTGSVLCQPESADFILCLEQSARDIITTLKKGSLTSPDHGATILYHVESISNQVDPGLTTFSLRGPGIKGLVMVSVDGLDIGEPSLWMATRMDYPTGVDVFLVSRKGEIISLPRSVSIIQTGANEDGVCRSQGR